MKTKKINTELLIHDDELLSINQEYLIAEKTYRFIILVICALLSFANGFQWFTFSSVANEFGKHYNLSYTGVNLLSNFHGIIYILMTIPSFYLIEKKSIKMAVCFLLIRLKYRVY